MKEKNWKEIPLGGLILEAGNAEEYETGSWRTYRPIRDEEKNSLSDKALRKSKFGRL
ncbi:unnamed protein product, partial [marine sediment metagenome]